MPPEDSSVAPTESRIDLSAVKVKPPTKKARQAEPAAKPRNEPPTLKQSERRRKQLQNDVLEQEVSRLRWDKRLRLVACAAIFGIVVGWLWAVRQLLVLPAGERPTDAVLVAALCTTTVNVLGLLYIVARYLFPQQQRSKHPNTTVGNLK